MHLRVGSVSLSAAHPARLLVEAFALFIAAHLLAASLAQPIPASRLRTLALVFGLLAALTLDSTPRRIGDGHEYVLMAFQLAHLRPPALVPADLEQFRRELPAGDTYKDVQLTGGVAGRDGRRDFVHFWFYSLLAAPFVRLAEVVGAHPNTGFTVLNLLLLAVAGVVLARRLSPALVAVILAGPFVWWLDKAHTEVFTVAALTIGVMLIEERPWWAVLALGAATTQNPAIGVAAVILAGFAIARGAWRDRRFLLAAGGAAALCALHPAYYQWHLGRLSPLESVITRHVPGITALATPLVDPNLGVLIYYPAFTLLLVVGLAVLVRHPRTTASGSPVAWPLLLTAGVFLVAFAQTPNVNHGGTFNPSRYGLWLIPLAIPLLRAAEDRLGRARPVVMTALAIFATTWCAYMFAPRWSENPADPTTMARLLYAHAPSWYNPLPEVFAERQLAREDASLPLATPGCTKVLLAGDGTTRPPWPIPCTPQNVPAACQPVGALCYANGAAGRYSFAVAPWQAGFSYHGAAGWTWKDANDPRMLYLLNRLGTTALNPFPAGKPRSFIAQAFRLPWNQTWQGDRALIAWLPRNTTDCRLRLNVPFEGVATWIDQKSEGEIELGRVDLPAARDVWVSVPDVAAPVLLITPRLTTEAAH